MGNINLENVISDLSQEIKKNHPDISTVSIANIIREAINSEMVKEYYNDLKEEQDNNTPMNFIKGNVKASLEKIEEQVIAVKDAITVLEIEVDGFMPQDNTVVQKKNITAEDLCSDGIYSNKSYNNIEVTEEKGKDGINVVYHPADYSIDEPLISAPKKPEQLHITENDKKAFVSSMQHAIEKEIAKKGSPLYGIEKVTNGIYIAFSKEHNLYYKGITAGCNDRERMIKKYVDEGFLEELTYFYMIGIWGKEYQPQFREHPDLSFKIIPEDKSNKYLAILINNINAFLLKNCSKKIESSDDIKTFAEKYHSTFNHQRFQEACAKWNYNKCIAEEQEKEKNKAKGK